MIQLTFEPAFDSFHAVFRLLRLRPTIQRHGPLHRDHVRILDFYLLFPFRIDGIRLIPQHRKYRALAAHYQDAKPYGELPEEYIVFTRMEPMQIAALETLAAREFITARRLRSGEIEATSLPIPEAIAARIEDANAHDTELMEFLRVLASDYTLTGPDGLKSRTKLLEYRYDAV